MKKSLVVMAVLSFILTCPLNSQGLLNKVKKAVANEILGSDEAPADKNSPKPGPEPACACDNAKLIADLAKFRIDYREIAVKMNDDGSILVTDRLNGKAYIIRDGSTQGPFGNDDPRVTAFDKASDGDGSDSASPDWPSIYPGFISRSGEDYLITFKGQKYGPYAVISDFAVSRTKESFAAIVTKQVMATEDMNRKMEAELNKAKTDQEKMEIAMKYSQQISERLIQGGGDSESFQPQIVSNVPGAEYDVMKWMGGRLNSKIRFDEIVVLTPSKILDLKGNTLIAISGNHSSAGDLFLNTTNTRYASYNYGTLTFSDNSTLSELFNPQLVKADGKIYLTYMYYSPGNNAIMQCSMPF